MDTCWGIDLGGTKIEGVVLAEDKVLARRRIPTEAPKGYAHILGQIESLVRLLEEETGSNRPARIGTGTPGSTEPTTGLLKNSNTLCLNDKPLGEDLSRTLGVETILANDANCFALAEATLGAARGHNIVFGVIMGTGCGGGVVVHGQVLNGAHGIAGEWGHNVLYPDGSECYCGKKGCVEQYLSGTGISQRHFERTGHRCTVKEIAAGTRPADRETMDLLCEDFGKALSTVVNILDPDAIVLGGGVGNVDLLYTKGVQELAKGVFNPKFHTPLLRPQLGDSAGVFGAAMLAREQASM